MGDGLPFVSRVLVDLNYETGGWGEPVVPWVVVVWGILAAHLKIPSLSLSHLAWLTLGMGGAGRKREEMGNGLGGWRV